MDDPEYFDDFSVNAIDNSVTLEEMYSHRIYKFTPFSCHHRRDSNQFENMRHVIKKFFSLLDAKLSVTAILQIEHVASRGLGYFKPQFGQTGALALP